MPLCKDVTVIPVMTDILIFRTEGESELRGIGLMLETSPENQNGTNGPERCACAVSNVVIKSYNYFCVPYPEVALKRRPTRSSEEIQGRDSKGQRTKSGGHRLRKGWKPSSSGRAIQLSNLGELRWTISSGSRATVCSQTVYLKQVESHGLQEIRSTKTDNRSPNVNI